MNQRVCNLLYSHFPATVFGRVEQGIDFWHVIEKPSPTAALIFGAEHTKSELHRWRLRLRCANHAAEEIPRWSRMNWNLSSLRSRSRPRLHA